MTTMQNRKKLTIGDVDHSNVVFEFPDMPQLERLKEAIYYISEKCGSDPSFGATKLNKVLFYADFISFARFNEPVTGVSYQHLPNGPAPMQLLQAREELEEQGYIKVESRLYFTKRQTRTVIVQPYDFRYLTTRDLRLLNEVIDVLKPYNATGVSELSHNTAYRVTENGDLIAYNSVFLADETVSARYVRSFTSANSMNDKGLEVNYDAATALA